MIEASKHGDLIFDVGMHQGEDSEFYLRKGFRVVAFEADPDLVHSCRARLKQFIDQGRLTVVEGAIVDPEVIDAGQEKVRFYRSDEHSPWGTIVSDWKERYDRFGAAMVAREVDAIDFVSAIREHGVPHYMKIDIEGSDMVCVRALAQFRERPDYLSMESDRWSFAAVRREIETLAGLGYDAFQAIEQSRVPRRQTPPDPAREGEYVPHRFGRHATGLFGAELGGRWKTKPQILRRYRALRFGYFWVGGGGPLHRKRWRVRGLWRFRARAERTLDSLLGARAAGWNDLHARHSSLGLSQPGLIRRPAQVELLPKTRAIASALAGSRFNSSRGGRSPNVGFKP